MEPLPPPVALFGLQEEAPAVFVVDHSAWRLGLETFSLGENHPVPSRGAFTADSLFLSICSNKELHSSFQRKFPGGEGLPESQPPVP